MKFPATFDRFGKYGRLFTSLFNQTYEEFLDTVPRQDAKKILLENELIFSDFWHVMLLSFAEGTGLLSSWVDNTWPVIETIFPGKLQSLSDANLRITKLKKLAPLINIFHRTLHDLREQFDQPTALTKKFLRTLGLKYDGLQISDLCYGPFTDCQLQYLLDHDPRILEFGSGTAYFLQAFNELGGDAIGYDNGEYQSMGLQDRCFLSDRTKLIIQLTFPDPKIIEDRSLLISWAQPNSSFPVRAVRWYRKNGGKRFLLKIGAYGVRLGNINDVHFKAEPYEENLPELLNELGEHWVEAKDPPKFVPMLFHNNLLAFELK